MARDDGWIDNEPVKVGVCPECGRIKTNPHALDACHGTGATPYEGAHLNTPLQVKMMTLQEHHNADLPELVRRVRWLLTVEEAPIPQLSRESLVKQLWAALRECDPDDEFPMREP